MPLELSYRCIYRTLDCCHNIVEFPLCHVSPLASDTEHEIILPDQSSRYAMSICDVDIGHVN